MHRYHKTNAALGYQQFAYLFKLEENKYLCCNSPHGSFYETGAIITDTEYMDFDKVSKEEFIRNSNIHKDLINYLVGE